MASSSSSSTTDLTILAQAGQVTDTSQRRYILTEPLPRINEVDVSVYRDWLIEVLQVRGNVKKVEAEKYCDPAGMEIFVRAVTHISVSPLSLIDNYEMLEQLGDTVVNKAFVWHFESRFPEIMKMGYQGVQYFSRMKSLLTSKPFLAHYCQKLGLDRFIRWRKLKYTTQREGREGEAKEQERETVVDSSMREDVFEAWMAAVEKVVNVKEGIVGVGSVVVSSITDSILSEEHIPSTLEELVDYVTQLKENFDRRKNDWHFYWPDKDTQVMYLYIWWNIGPPPVGGRGNPTDEQRRRSSVHFQRSLRVITGGQEGYATSQKIVKQQLAKDALVYLEKNLGIKYQPQPKSRTVTFAK